MYDDDELIEIRPDTMQNNNMADMIYAPNDLMLFRENSKDSVNPLYLEENTFANQSLENVKDTTVNNSPINRFKHINVNPSKREIFIENRMSIDNESFGTTSPYNTDQTGIMRYSQIQANTTVI